MSLDNTPTKVTTPPGSRLRAWYWLVTDTFRQAKASAVMWLMLAVSFICFLLCLSASTTGPAKLAVTGNVDEFLPENAVAKFKAEDVAALLNYSAPWAGLSQVHIRDQAFRAEAKRTGVSFVKGKLSLGFGAFSVEHGRDAQDATRFFQTILAGGVADTLGILLALIWTAGFLPGFLEHSSIAVLLAKPLPRWSLLLGKFLGVLAFVGLHACVFVFSTWFALGIKLGDWSMQYLMCIPMLLLHFGVFFSFSMLLAVITRSTVACVFGSILFWLVCWCMNYGRHALVANVGAPGFIDHVPFFVEWCYWVFPKPGDMGILFFHALDAGNFVPTLFEYERVQQMGKFFGFWSVLSSIAFGVLCLWGAVAQFNDMDY